MTDWSSIIRKIAPNGKASIINGFASAMPQIIKIANLNNSKRITQFIAQVAHESDGFRTTTEYASGKEYNNRVDLGNRKGTNDGVTYKGRGLIQLTGRSNYASMSKLLGVDLVKQPNLAAQFPYAALTSAYYWRDHNLNPLADIGDIDGITRRINGGYNGLSDRKAYLRRAQAEVSDISMAQRRLQELNYPPGGVDGKAGLLTRSAVRDFQDANNLPINGNLDAPTLEVLHSDSAISRPVDPERAALTAVDLKEKGSQIIEASDDVKSSAIGTGVAAFAGATTTASTIASNLSTVAETAKSGSSLVQIADQYWPIFVIAASVVAIIYFAWRTYATAQKIEDRRVMVAQTGQNVRI